ncbi:hypothetical protein KBD59_03725 [Candidatus Gracilibacteria bacterium]|nr:hypothetical protein [Candidatus Gracilibacteria bacterium]
MTSTHSLWIMKITTRGAITPLIRIMLLMRKFRVEIVEQKTKRLKNGLVESTFLLDFAIATRTDTIFRKLARIYEIEKMAYSKGKRLGAATVKLK